jgi:predicted CopG family antitoxin
MKPEMKKDYTTIMVKKDLKLQLDSLKSNKRETNSDVIKKLFLLAQHRGIIDSSGLLLTDVKEETHGKGSNPNNKN